MRHFDCAPPLPPRLAIALPLLATWLAGPLAATVLPNPTITAAAAASSTTNAVTGIFDNEAESTEYRTNGAGNNTYIEFDFGSSVTIDGFVNVTRNSTSSIVTGSRLIFDTDGISGFNASTDSVVSFTATNIGSQGQGYVNRFAPVTARKVRWEVTANTGNSHSCGAMEMRFLGTAATSAPITGIAVIGGSPALDSEHAAANASNGLAGRRPTSVSYTPSPSVGYKSSGQGTNTYVDFDLGQIRQVSGFDFFDNLAADQRVNGFTLKFSNDPSFASTVAVKTYSGNQGFTLSDSFTPAAARYVRYQVTACAGANPGLSELVFYESTGATLPAGFSSAQNPANGWQHGIKASPQAASLEAYDAMAASVPTAPCNRWIDSELDNTFAGTAPADAATTGWGGVNTEWESGAFYHAWRSQPGVPVVSRYVITKTGAYNVNAVWKSHTLSGCAASTWIVVNGNTVASGSINGFAGTPRGTVTPSGTSPATTCEALGLSLNAGATIDIVTVPVTSAGNICLSSSITETQTVAESTSSVVIREFCASNQSGLSDEDGEKSDWIELYNGTGAAIDLTDWSLTDKSTQPRQWVFPTRILPHGRRLVVFASGKDASKRPGYGPDSELHTNFSLSKSGEFLGLADPSGQFVSSFSPQFPSQADDITYGTGSNAITGYMQPTPGAPNGSASSQPPATLTFSAPSGIFSGTLNVMITGQSAGHTVRYTTDGTEPTLTSGTTYTGGAIAITASTTLRARAFSDGVGGPLAQATYTLRGTTAQYGVTPSNFVSSLPILVIDAPTSPPSDKSPVVSRFTLIDRSTTDGKTRLTDTPAITTRGTVKLRGQYSSSFPKKSYSIEFWDGADQDQALEVLGMPAESDWVIYAAYQTDTDFLRNVLMCELFRRMGRWAPHDRYVEVFFNTTAGSPVDGADYYGIYVLREKIKVDSNRVDITKMTSLDNSGDAVTGGYIIAHDKYGNLEQTHPELLTGNRDGITHWPYAAGGAFVYKSPSVNDLTAAQKAYITDYVLQCDAAIAAPDFRNPITGLSYTDYIARDSFIDHHMLMAFAKNLDGIRISSYFQKDRGGKLRMSAVWDHDLSQDSDTNSADDNPATWNSDMPVSAGYSDYFTTPDGHTAEGWFYYLHQNPSYLQEWVDRFDRWRNTGVLDSTAINAFMDLRAAELVVQDNNGTASANTPIARNFARWSRSTRGTTTNGSNATDVIFGTAPTSEINRHKTWLAQRLAFMDTYVLKKPVASPATGVVAAGTPLSLSSPDLTSGAKIWYTTNGTDPFAEDGSVAPGAIEWTGPIALTTSTRITARLRNPTVPNKHTAWSAPLESNYVVNAVAASSGNLAVSELMYHPADPTAAEIAAGFTSAEDFEFIELRNTGTSRINLWGSRFVDGIEFTFDNELPVSLAELNPGQTILLAANSNAFTLRYGASAAARLAGSFANGSNLSNSGERLRMVDAAGSTILDFTYSDAVPWPFSADGLGNSLHYLSGSPGSADSWFAAAADPGSIATDSDGDGQSDLAEWMAGTDPANAASRFTLSVLSYSLQTGISLSHPAVLGHTYRVERSTDLKTWQAVGPDWTAAQSGMRTVTDASAPGQRAFYRVVAVARP